MASNSLPVADLPVNANRLAEARHKGWLAGVALRLGCGTVSTNPYKRSSEEFLYWNAGFEEGFAG